LLQWHDDRITLPEAEDKLASMTGDPSRSAEVAIVAAMDRVLQAERDALAAVAESERLSAAELEQARQERRTILERTQARIVALHARAAQALERRAAEILERRHAALARLATRLTTPEGPLPGVGR
jgi:hypothetical protein